ncbi:MAG: hypothetical protein LRY73_01695 [Bacillus sp. (in: Bacteria)]|nr:hypothetical protein [Bacillus sp. (in: firmicutes)]
MKQAWRSERRRLQQEKQRLKTPQGDFPEEAEALPAEASACSKSMQNNKKNNKLIEMSHFIKKLIRIETGD